MLRTHYITLPELGGMARDCRYSLHMKQRELAQQLHVTQQAISAFERGESKSLDLFLWYLNHGAFDKLETNDEFEKP